MTESLHSKAISFAKNYTTISDKDIDIITQCRKSLLFDNETAWTKKNQSDMFDVTMGSFDGAEDCEFIGLFLLNNLKREIQRRALQRRRAGTSKKRKRTKIRTD